MTNLSLLYEAGLPDEVRDEAGVASPPSDPCAPRRSGYLEPGSLEAASVLPVLPALAGLFQDGGMRRGATLGVRAPGGGATSLLGALLAPVTGSGYWGGVVGVPGLGVESLAGLGVDCTKLVFIPDPGDRWGDVTGVLLAALDVVVLGCSFPGAVPGDHGASHARGMAPSGMAPCGMAPSGMAPSGMARRLVDRARVGRSTLILAGSLPAWPVALDTELVIRGSHWDGLQQGYGRLLHREVTVLARGRRAAGRERQVRVFLPSAGGSVESLPLA